MIAILECEEETYVVGVDKNGDLIVGGGHLAERDMEEFTRTDIDVDNGQLASFWTTRLGIDFEVRDPKGEIV